MSSQVVSPGFWRPDRKFEVFIHFFGVVMLLAFGAMLILIGAKTAIYGVFMLLLVQATSLSNWISAARPMARALARAGISDEDAYQQTLEAAAAGWVPDKFSSFGLSFHFTYVFGLVLLFLATLLGSERWISVAFTTASLLVLAFFIISFLGWRKLHSRDWQIRRKILPPEFHHLLSEGEKFLQLSPNEQLPRILEISRLLERESVKLQIEGIEPRDVEFEQHLRDLCEQHGAKKQFLITDLRRVHEVSGHRGNFHAQLYHLKKQGRLWFYSNSYQHHGTVFPGRDRIYHGFWWRKTRGSESATADE